MPAPGAAVPTIRPARNAIDAFLDEVAETLFDDARPEPAAPSVPPAREPADISLGDYLKYLEE
jgi:hypothetical protein